MGHRIILILDNIRSAYNVGAIFRSADAFGVDEIIACGITPYPKLKDDSRLPHVAAKATTMITKTALGAERTISSRYFKETSAAIEHLKDKGYKIYCLEQTKSANSLDSFKPEVPYALVVGNEVTGVSRTLLDTCDAVIEIRMQGQKESLNVSVACGIALYELTKHDVK